MRETELSRHEQGMSEHFYSLFFFDFKIPCLFEFLKEKRKEEFDHEVNVEKDLERAKLELASIVGDEGKNFCTEVRKRKI